MSPSSGPAKPKRPASPVSLYSHYSYYPLDSPIPSPTSPNAPSNAPSTTHLSPDYVPSQSSKSPPTPAPEPAPSSSAQRPNLDNPTTAEDFLQLGINHHEANRLTESAVCFEKSATIDGGCGVGMLMWGLAQRHGWGCPQSESAGFRWLRRAAEVAVEDLERARAGQDSGAVKSELVLAIYEVGQSFFRGWGVEKDKKMAVSYFRVAARLGDPDAQQDLAFCLANGKGCKKDKIEAAKWYRAAVAQGVSDVGLAWIYKDKYQ
ncbi:HCP-like protein [Rhodofomes roseus]|uniref:HCP-like protein n=1 Tax=Rhodofomes roseus TaxID=34475 RepID=A0ABQ8KG12_9APHY|nr:HCP-like protein [Rhodofomes roseus]KAH9836713.1 HCP-like protein [Rhodofomes roseus]